MAFLVLATGIWLVTHLGVAGTRLRPLLAERIGEGGFMATYSVISLASFIVMVSAFRHAPLIPIWAPNAATAWLAVALMLPASMLFVASVAGRNPTAAGQALPQDGPRGITRITRHPMLVSFALWGLVHLLANGDAASLVFFGGIAATALLGMPSIDAKLERRDPTGWAVLSRQTSIVPFRAIAEGRTRLAAREIPIFVPVLGLVVWALLLGAHPHVIGVPALPG